MIPISPQSIRRSLSILALAALSLLIFGCKFEVVSFPNSIEVGQDVEFVMRVESESIPIDPILSARIPSGWDLLSATYEESTSNPESGPLLPSESGPFCISSFGGPGYQSLALEADPEVHFRGVNSVIIRLVFHINSNPEGHYRTWFSLTSNGVGCDYLITNWNRDELPSFNMGSVHPIEFEVSRRAPSAFGPFVYFANGSNLMIFRQSEENLSLENIVRGQDHPLWGLENCNTVTGRTRETFSSVYLGCAGKTLALRQNFPNSEDFSLIQRLDDDDLDYFNTDFEISSPNGNLVARTGDPGQIYSTTNDGSITDSLRVQRHSKMTLSGDELNAYVSDYPYVRSYDIQTDPVVQIQTIHENNLPTDFSDPEALVTHPNGRYVYVSSPRDRNITVFARDSQTGLLEYQSVVSNLDLPETLGLFDPRILVISNDGMTLAAISYTASAISFFQISPETGDLQYQDAIFNGDAGYTQLTEISAGTFSLDGKYLYLVGPEGLIQLKNSEICNDGFESGDLGQWSSSSP